MNSLERIESSLYKIKNVLKADSNIRKLLYYTTKDALTKNEVSYSKMDNFITLQPVFNMNVEQFNRNAFISIAISEMEEAEEETLYNGVLRINVICKNENWEIDDNKIRPLRIISIIKDLLDNRKFDASHKLFFVNMQIVTLDEYNSGYMVLFGITEGAGLEYEF